MKSSDGKFYKKDTLDTKGILRLIKSRALYEKETKKSAISKGNSKYIDEVKQIENKEGEKDD